MNRFVLSTVAVLVALVGFAMLGEDQEATAGLFSRKCAAPSCCEPEPTCCEPAPSCGKKHKCGGGLFARMKARKCHKADCCEPVTCCAPEPTCCEAPACEPSCGCEAAPSCGCETAACGCEAAAPACGCAGGGMMYEQGMAPGAAPVPAEGGEGAAPEAPQGAEPPPAPTT